MKLKMITASIATTMFAFAAPKHGFSVFGETLKYPENFTHYDYVNPDAPKGGKMVIGTIGSFDSLNPLIVKGNPVQAIQVLCHARLLADSWDVPAQAYAYLAESVDVADDNSSVTFHLRKDAKFSDGVPITAKDIAWTFETLKTKAVPMYRTYFKDVKNIEIIDDHTLKFNFKTTKNKELAIILGQLPALPRHFYEAHPFEESSLKVPPTSGPYSITKVKPGQSITFKRVKNWWGENIPSQKGIHNTDIRLDYYRDSTARFEAFKAGKFDIFTETSIKNWMTAYNFPAIAKGEIIKAEIEHDLCSGTSGLFFNTRRPFFQDIRVRKALTLALDFDWMNQKLFYNQYRRNHSYYPNCDFEAEGVPTAEELKLLDPFKDKLPAELFTSPFTLPSAKTEAEKREVLTQASNLLKEAGYILKDGVLIDEKTQKPLTFELLISDVTYEKIGLNFKEMLKRLGIDLVIRLLDSTAYTHRVEQNDFDMIWATKVQSTNLGNEQRDYFGSERADAPGTINHAGIKNPVVDALIEELIQSPTYEDLKTRAHALDRVLLFNYYMIPAWHSNNTKVAYWNKFDKPAKAPKYHPFHYESWWLKPTAKDAASTSVEEKVSVSLTHRFKNWLGL